VEWRGLRLLIDPTFDPAGTRFEFPGYALVKTQGPALPAGELGPLDAVLVSHDHHKDNFDDGGRAVAETAPRVLTTADGAERLGGNATGLSPWEQTELHATNGDTLMVTATPARHGPAGGDRGPVIGFGLAFSDTPDDVFYISGDTVWYEGVGEVAERFPVKVAALNLGAAKVAPAGDSPVTFTAAGALEAARAMPEATIVPLHFEGWEHFSESRKDVEKVFGEAGLSERLAWPPPGAALALSI
jgi:L-ascorbate metabolism protein UlaG (beta-lactamase superfamily)